MTLSDPRQATAALSRVSDPEDIADDDGLTLTIKISMLMESKMDSKTSYWLPAMFGSVSDEIFKKITVVINDGLSHKLIDGDERCHFYLLARRSTTSL